MFKKEITYTNFENEVVTELHWFNLTKAELIEMELEQSGGMKGHIERIIESDNQPEIMKTFKSFIRKAYGVRSDGRFIKSSEISDSFLASEAYSELILELITDAESAAAFMNGLVPKGIEEAAARIQASAENEDNVAKIANGEVLTPGFVPKALTRRDIHEMDPDEFRSGIATGRYTIADEPLA